MEKLISKMDWLEAATVGSLIVTYLVISSALNVEAILYPGNKNIFYTIYCSNCNFIWVYFLCNNET